MKRLMILSCLVICFISIGCNNNNSEKEERTLGVDDTLDIEESDLFEFSEFEKDGIKYEKLTSKWMEFTYPLMTQKKGELSESINVSARFFDSMLYSSYDTRKQQIIVMRRLGFPVFNFDDNVDAVTYTLFNAQALLLSDKDEYTAIGKSGELPTKYESVPLTITREEFDEMDSKKSENTSINIEYPGIYLFIFAQHRAEASEEEALIDMMEKILIKAEVKDNTGKVTEHWYKLSPNSLSNINYYKVYEII